MTGTDRAVVAGQARAIADAWSPPDIAEPHLLAAAAVLGRAHPGATWLEWR